MIREIEELLPFYVNGTLEGEELLLVENAVRDNPDLQEEVALLKRLQAEMCELPVENSPGELGLRRLQNALSQDRQGARMSTGKTSNVKSISRMSWRAVAIAACVLLIVQTIALLPQWVTDSGEDNLIAAGGSSVIAPYGRILTITFVPDAREENIRQMLLSVGARIVDGPSALGVYKLSVATNDATVVKKLKARRNLVESVRSDTLPEQTQ